jgi:putative ABC transport system permease protein
MSASRIPPEASLRFYRQHPLQLALTLLGIALGAAVIVAVAIATRAAAESFDRSLDALTGPMTHELRAREGALPEDLYRELRVERGLRIALPLLRQRLEVAGETVELLGTDPLAFLNVPADSGPPQFSGGSVGDLMLGPDAVLVPAELAARLELSEGEPFTASTGERLITLQPVATLASEAGDWLGGVLLTDIASFQNLLRRAGELDSIQLRLAREEAQTLARNLPPGVELRAFDDQRQTFDDMTRAFRTNLTAMSLLAVLVAAFLVYNAMSFAVVQRRPTLAVLRMLGATSQQLFRRLLVEAAVLGVGGAVLGLVAGVFLGQSLLVLVTRTVSDLYVSVDALRPDLAWEQLLAALLVTVGAVLIAAFVPARDAATTQPAALERESMEQGDDRSAWRSFTVGAVLALTCPVLIVVSGDSLGAAFLALFLLVLAYALLCPLLIRLTLSLLLRLSGGFGGSRLRLTFRGVQSALPRTGPALIALAVAVAATVGVAIMIGSFRSSVADWLDSTLAGDLYVYRDAAGARLDPAWEQRLAALPGVASVSAARQRRLSIDGEDLRTLVLDGSAVATRSFDILDGSDDAVRRVLAGGEGILVSEPLAQRRNLAPGDRLTLATPGGSIELTLRGVYRDYASSYGAAVLPYAVYAEHWRDRELSSLALMLTGLADAAAVRRAVLQLGSASDLDLTVISNHAIRERSLAIFDRTFVITDVLRALVVIVAFVGILSALLALFLERRREFAVLRATGFTPGELFRLILGQAATSGVLAGLLSLPLGVALSLLLIDVINRRSFGWTISTHVDSSVLLQAVVLAVTAAAVAAIWPARRLAAGDLREALYAP